MGDMGGFALAPGMGGGAAQTWSPSSAIGTGLPHVEHLTEGSIWDILPGPGPGALRV